MCDAIVDVIGKNEEFRILQLLLHIRWHSDWLMNASELGGSIVRPTLEKKQADVINVGARHRSVKCQGPNRTELSYNCREPGHKVQECRNHMKCWNCRSTYHRTVGSTCKQNKSN